MIKKIDDVLINFLSVHFKKVYMVNDETKLHITLYDRSRHMHDMPQKLTLIESYLVRLTTLFQCHHYRVGFTLRDPPLTAPPKIK